MDAQITVTLTVTGQSDFGMLEKSMVKTVTLTGDNPAFLAAELTKKAVPVASGIMAQFVNECASVYGTAGMVNLVKDTEWEKAAK